MEKKKNVGKILIACGCSALGAGVLACGIVMAINSNEFNSSMKKMLEVNTPAKIFNTSDISDQTTGTVYGTLSAANIAAYSDVNDIIYAKGDHA
ncbi:hypothetical protein FACS1894166_07480 [Bacilli bacterium]|nr:hypothetical protein FACS1894166_07480 [Bacilli bacterium]